MKPSAPQQYLKDYERVAQAITLIENNFLDRPSLEDLAHSVNLSSFHFERLFKRFAGISPHQFIRFLTHHSAKAQLRANKSILETAWSVGLSGSSRLHDLMLHFTAMSPGAYKALGHGLCITYGIHPTPFGMGLIALTQQGICHLSFHDGNQKEAVSLLQMEWPKAQLLQDQQKTLQIMENIFIPTTTEDQPFHLFLKGTNFQISVWQALLRIPPGYIVSYEDIAHLIGKPKAIRAVAHSIARNPISYLIPCHRVIRKSGYFHQYRWGSVRKKALLLYETGRFNNKTLQLISSEEKE